MVCEVPKRFSAGNDIASGSLKFQRVINPLKCSGVTLLHFRVFSAIQVLHTFLISDIRALGLQSARMSEIKNVPGWQNVTS